MVCHSRGKIIKLLPCTLWPICLERFQLSRWDTQVSFWKGLGFPGSASGKEPACQLRRRQRQGFNPGVWKIPRSRAWRPALPGNPMGEEPVGLWPTGPQGGHAWSDFAGTRPRWGTQASSQEPARPISPASEPSCQGILRSRWPSRDDQRHGQHLGWSLWETWAQITQLSCFQIPNCRKHVMLSVYWLMVPNFERTCCLETDKYWGLVESWGNKKQKEGGSSSPA